MHTRVMQVYLNDTEETEMHPQIAFVNSNKHNIDTVLPFIKNELQFKETVVTSLSKFFGLFNDPDLMLDLIIFDVNCLASEACTDIFDLLNTVDTLIKVNQIEKCPVLSVNIAPDTATNIIKNVMTTDLKGFLYDIENPARVQETCFAFTQLIDGKGYVSKEISDRTKTIRRNGHVKNLNKVNGISLTLRQEQILNLICTRGSSNKNIARILNLSESTVKLHIGAILKKYGLKNRTQLALFTRSYYTKK